MQRMSISCESCGICTNVVPIINYLKISALESSELHTRLSVKLKPLQSVSSTTSPVPHFLSPFSSSSLYTSIKVVLTDFPSIEIRSYGFALSYTFINCPNKLEEIHRSNVTCVKFRKLPYNTKF